MKKVRNFPKVNTKILIAFVLMIPFLVIPFYSEFIDGVFIWHVSQPALWKDLVELGVYIGVLIALGSLFQNIRAILIYIVPALYLLSMGTLLQTIVAYIYVEFLILVGRSLGQLLFKKKYCTGVQFLIGTIVWGFGAIILSLLKHGTINELRVYTIVLLIVSLIVVRNRFEIKDLLCVEFYTYIKKSTRCEFLLNVLFISFLMIAFARVNTYIESDSLWYGIYTEQNLFGENSFYDFLGYTGFIYYYPKFRELLVAPLSGLKIPGYVIAPNLWIMIIMVKETYQYMKDELNGKKNQALLGSILVFTTLCIIGISGTAKSDTLSYFYMLLFFILINKFIKGEENTYLYLALSSIVMSYSTKYTSYLFATLMILTLIVPVIRIIKRNEFIQVVRNKGGWILLGSSLFVLAGIIFRTLLLTGYPFFRVGIGTLNEIGFTAKPYFDVDPDYYPHNTFEPFRLFATFFEVSKSGKIMTQWIGNYYIFFLILIFILGIKREKKNLYNFLLASVLSIASLCCLVVIPSPDGNYFGIPVIIVSLVIMNKLFNGIEEIKFNKFIDSAVIIFIILNFCFNFVAHPSWGTGTRFSYEKINVIKTEEENYDNINNDLIANGIYKINEALQEEGNRVLIIADGDINFMRLEARIELASTIFNKFLSAAGTESYENFVEYVNKVGVGGFIVPNDDSGVTEFKEYVNQYIEDYSINMSIIDEKYTYYSLKTKSYDYEIKNDMIEQEVCGTDGYYEDGWCDRISNFSVKGKKGEKVVFHGLSGDEEVKNEHIDIYINGEYTDTLWINEAEFTIEYLIDTNKPFNITLVSTINAEKNEKEERDLSWKMTKMYVK